MGTRLDAQESRAGPRATSAYNSTNIQRAWHISMIQPPLVRGGTAPKEEKCRNKFWYSPSQHYWPTRPSPRGEKTNEVSVREALTKNLSLFILSLALSPMAALLYVRIPSPSPAVSSPHRNRAISTLAFLRHLALLTILFDILNFPTHPHWHPCRPYSVSFISISFSSRVQVTAAAFTSKGKWPCRTMTSQAPAFPFSQSTPNLVFLVQAGAPRLSHQLVYSVPLSMMKLWAAACGPPNPVNPPPPRRWGREQGSVCMKTWIMEPHGISVACASYYVRRECSFVRGKWIYDQRMRRDWFWISIRRFPECWDLQPLLLTGSKDWNSEYLLKPSILHPIVR